MSLPASIIVNVQTEIPPVIDTSTGENRALFLMPATQDFPATERVRAYYDSASIATDFDTSSECYKAGVAFFSQNPHPPTLYLGAQDTGETAVEALAACLAKVQFYGLAMQHSMFVDADALNVAAFADSQIMLFGWSSGDTKIVDAADTTDFATKLQAYSRSFCFARENAMEDYPELAALARTIGVDLRLPNSANTIGVQSLQGIQPSTFTQAQFNAAIGKQANIYEQIGPAPVVYPGVMASGLFIEDQFGIDYIQAYITVLAIAAIETAKRIPQTDQGMNYIVGYLDTGLAQIVQSGFLAAGYWDAESISGIVNNGELLPKGYKIVAAPIKSLTPPQRVAGFGSNIGIALKGAGAIHGLNIYMPFNP